MQGNAPNESLGHNSESVKRLLEACWQAGLNKDQQQTLLRSALRGTPGRDFSDPASGVRQNTVPAATQVSAKSQFEKSDSTAHFQLKDFNIINSIALAQQEEYADLS